ncbi:AGE family epimerase/isomerase [Burkholderia cepacia]|uniref:AGE family epimerase/isomerase n=1 Tax=Burkholderia cepacia TaxID=292 RepID=UPI002FE23F11
MNKYAAVAGDNVIASLKAHYADQVLSIWCRSGFNRELGLAFEAVSSDSLEPLTPTRYRAMACARQLFVFALAGQFEHATLLFESLKNRFEDKQNGGWIFSVDEKGNPADCRKDLYTHAFVIFSVSEYARLSRNVEACSIVDETTEWVVTKFSMGDGAPGLLNSVMSEDGGMVVEGPLQNPMMHLTEAWLAARRATGDSSYDRRLEELIGAVARTFVHEPTGCIAELPIGLPENRIEPGHQFEWYFLAHDSAHSAFEASGLRASLAKGFDFARRHGVDPLTSGVCAAVDEHGRLVDSTQRIWAQTEYLRALATHESAAVRACLQEVVERFRVRFLHEKGWFECLSPEGVVTRTDMPSTTPYHMATALSSLA